LKKSALYPSGEKVHYIAFQYSSRGVELAQGEVVPKGRSFVEPKFALSTLKAVKEAIEKLNG
ncbi:MAG: hypothetical protein AAFV25_11065, partial [Bacteroidota bacterium]